jgi:hypothetical protein
MTTTMTRPLDKPRDEGLERVEGLAPFIELSEPRTCPGCGNLAYRLRPFALSPNHTGRRTLWYGAACHDCGRYAL